MKILRKLFVLGIFILFISGLMLLGALRQEREQITSIPQTKQESIKFPKDSKSDLPVKVDKKLELQTPENLPTISVVFGEITKNKSTKIAKELGFNENMNELKDITEGTKYLWSNNEYYLWITPKKSYLNYAMNQFPKNINDKHLTEGAVKEKALDFMVNKFDLDENSIEVVSVSHYKVSHYSEGFSKTTKNDSQLFHVDITYKEINFPVLTSIPKFQILYVEILPDGEVYKASAYLLNEFKQSNESYRVKNLDDIKSSLEEAHLISVENDYIHLIDIKPTDVKKVDIQDIKVGYFFDDISINTTLQPVFLLEGEVEIKNSTADWAKLYMPALK